MEKLEYHVLFALKLDTDFRKSIIVGSFNLNFIVHKTHSLRESESSYCIGDYVFCLNAPVMASVDNCSFEYSREN